MIRENITAKWARETAQTVLSEKVEQQLNACLIAVENAAKRNEFYCHASIYPHDMTIKELNGRGFKTKYHDSQDQREAGYLEISW